MMFMFPPFAPPPPPEPKRRRKRIKDRAKIKAARKQNRSAKR